LGMWREIWFPCQEHWAVGSGYRPRRNKE
jgi:hypothetical protein